jgi:hypothetical protein
MTPRELVVKLADQLEIVLSTDQNENCWPAVSDEADVALEEAREWLRNNQP